MPLQPNRNCIGILWSTLCNSLCSNWAALFVFFAWDDVDDDKEGILVIPPIGSPLPLLGASSMLELRLFRLEGTSPSLFTLLSLSSCRELRRRGSPLWLWMLLLSSSTASSISSVILCMVQPEAWAWGIDIADAASSFEYVVARVLFFFCGLRRNQFSYQATASSFIPGFCKATVMFPRAHRIQRSEGAGCLMPLCFFDGEEVSPKLKACVFCF